MRNVVQFKDKNDELYAVKDIVARGIKANAVNLFNYKNASGEVVSVDDAVDESLLKLKVQINHVQDLHGYDNPWPGGSGKNKVDEHFRSGYSITDFGGVTPNTDSKLIAFKDEVLSSTYIPIEGNKTYTLSGKNLHKSGSNTNVKVCVAVYNSDKTFRNAYAEYDSTSGDAIKLNDVDVMASGTYLYRISVGADASEVMLENAVQATDYEPYANICPISGWDSANVSRTRQNLFDGIFVDGKYINSNGSIGSHSDYKYSLDYIPVNENTKYTINGLNLNTRANGNNDCNIVISYYNASKSIISQSTATTTYPVTVTTPANTAFVRFYCGIKANNVVFEEGATSTLTIYTYPFPQTVYDGELTINQDGTGTLVVDRGMWILDGTETGWDYTTASSGRRFRIPVSSFTGMAGAGDSETVLSDKFIWADSSNATWGHIRLAADYLNFTDNNSVIPDKATFLAWLSANNTQVYVPLATPVIYNLTSQQVIQLLEGHNTLWADTGSIEIDYPVEKLISKKEADESYSGMVYIKTESDAILDIEDGADAVPAKELTVNVNHMQDLHGYGNPWPGGGGKNLFDIDHVGDDWVNTSNQIIHASAAKSNIINVVGGTTLTLSCNIEATSTYVYLIAYLDSSDAVISRTVATSGSKVTAIAGSNAVKAIAGVYNMDITDAQIQVEIGSTNTEWQPYENICPIDGWDSADVERIGKNIFDKNDTSLRKNNVYLEASTGRTLEFVNDVRCVAIPCKSSQTYTISNGIKTTMRVASFTSNPPLNTYPTSANSPSGQTNAGTGLTITTGENDTYLVVQVIANADVSEGTTFANAIETLMIEEGSTVSPYKAYQGATYSYPFPETIYDGTLVIHQDGTGALTSANGNADLGMLTWTKYDGTGYADLYYTDSLASQIGPTPGDVTHGICSDFVVVDNTSHSGVDGSAIAQPYNSIRFPAMDGRIYLKVAGYSTAEELTQALNGVQLVYELATPIVYSLTNQQVVELLRGENHIWANCGNVKVTYPADTEIYIQKKVDSIDLDSKADKANPVFTGSISMGRNTAKETGQSSVATGMSAAATATGSHAEGYFTEATGEYSHAEGYEAKAYGRDAHAEGRNTLARANDSHAEGYKSEASGLRSHAEGHFAKASGDYSHAEGESNTAIGRSSHAEGYYSEATGEYSHVEGRFNGAYGANSHVFGMYASGDSFAKWGPHFMPDTEYAVGDKVWSEIIIMGEESIEIVYEGYVCNTAHTSGSAIDEAYWTRRYGLMKYAEIVGNGTGTSEALRSNARALDWDGNEYLNGDLYVKCNPDSTGGVKAATMNDIADLTKVTAPIINVDDDTPEAIKTIHDGAEGMPVKQLTVNIEPVQDLHGYDNPWPAGGGENLLDIDTITYGKWCNGEGVINNATYGCISVDIPVSGGSTVNIYSFGESPNSMSIIEYNNGVFTKRNHTYNGKSYVLDSTTTSIKAQVSNGTSAQYTITREILESFKVVVSIGEAQPSAWSPYSNICPISGRTSADVIRAGKNIFNKYAKDASKGYVSGKYLDVNGVETTPANPLWWVTEYIKIDPSTTYTVYGWYNSASAVYYSAEYDENKRLVNTIQQNSLRKTFTTTSTTRYIRMSMLNVTEVQLEKGSSSSTYEAYQDTTYTYPFPQSAGTVYNGNLTIHQDGSGTLVVDKELVSRNISDMNNSDSYPGWQGDYSRYTDRQVSAGQTVMNIGRYYSIHTAALWLPRSYYWSMTQTEWKAKYPDLTVEFILPLMNPIVYELTSQQVIELLKGTNNIWSNTGDTAIKYAADTKLYIDLKFAELQALILENISNS